MLIEKEEKAVQWVVVGEVGYFQRYSSLALEDQFELHYPIFITQHHLNMSFDFFNQGLKKESAPQFSNEENQFLQSKLPFLDPKKTNAIPIGTALDFLKFSGLRSDRIQKILKNCNVQSGKKTLTYDEMKKIFRGVALSQNDIQPSAININANIKTKLPIFYDEDSQEQAESKPQSKQVPPSSQQPQKPVPQNIPAQKPVEVKPQQDKINLFQGVFPPTSQPARPSMQPQKSNFAQFPPMQPSNHTSLSQTQTHSQKSSPQHPQVTNKIKQFEVKWKKLKTEGNKIDGGEVKNLCKKLSDRSILSRAWKLCCLSNPGSLTKGEFFVFLQMISNNKIPDQLSSEMKATIEQVDRQTAQASKQPQKVAQKALQQTFTPKASVMAPQSFNQLGASQLFENFTKIQPRAVTEVKIPREDENVQKIIARVSEGKKIVENNNTSELTQLRRGQEIMNNLMGEVQQFITAVDTRSNTWTTQIEELKQGQTLLNDRLNKVCMGMNSVIMRQHTLIQDLVSNLAMQNSINNQRVNVLENHINEIQQQLEIREQQLAQFVKQKQTERVEPIQKKVQVKAQVSEPIASPISEKVEEPQQQQQPASRKPQPAIRPQPTQQKQQQKHEQQHSPQPIQKAPSHDQETEQQQRIRQKRRNVLQLIMYLTPLTQQEMPALIQRISQYSEEQLNMVYINCYQKLQARQEMQAHRARQMQTAEDDFSTSNFKGEAAPTQNMFQ